VIIIIAIYSIRDLIILLSDNNSNVSKAEVDDNSRRAKSAAVNKSFLDSLETVIDSITPASLNSNI